MDQGTVILEAVRVSKRFPGVQALKSVSYQLRQGEVHALVGENGAGKSTLMRILSGVLTPDLGELRFRGKTVQIHNPNEAHRLGISLVPQELSLIPSLTANENIMLGAEPLRLRWVIDERNLRVQVREVANRLQMDFPLDIPVVRLSVAQRQLVQIARGVVHRSSVLILDEPTRALTDEEAARLFAVLHDLRGEGTATAYISHRLEEVLQIADFVTVLRDGAVTGSWPREQVEEGLLVRSMAGRDVEVGRTRLTPGGEVLLAVDGLSGPGFRNVSFTVKRGEIVGLGGLVGSGRSEVLWTLVGLRRPTGGRIIYKGKPFTARDSHDAIDHGLGLVPEERKSQALFGMMSVAENIAMPLLRQFTMHHVLNTRSIADHGRRMTEVLGIKTPDVHRPVMFLSGGNQQKTVLARWLNSHTDFLMLDEPTQGVDVASKAEIHALIRGAAERGCGVLLVSSEANELLSLAHRIVVLHKGRLQGTYAAAALTRERLLEAAMNVTAAGSPGESS